MGGIIFGASMGPMFAYILVSLLVPFVNLKVSNHQACGQSYKHYMLVNYDSRVVIWGIFQSGMTLES